MKYFILTLSLVFFAGSVSASIVIPWADQFTNNTFSITTGKLTFDLNRTAFYKAMQSEDKNLVDAQIAALNSTPSDIKNAFLGAMTMKRAGIGGNPVSRLMLFKKGHELLEAAIQQEPDNSEFRFLRLMIQENAPEMLG